MTTMDNAFIRIAFTDFTHASPETLGEEARYSRTNCTGMNNTPFLEDNVNACCQTQNTSTESANDEHKQNGATYEQKIMALEKQVLAQKRFHVDLENAIAKQERRTLEQERKFLEQDKKFADQERMNLAQERALLEQDKKLLAQDRKIADYEAILGLLERNAATCNTREAKIREHERTIAELSDRLAKLEASSTVESPMEAAAESGWVRSK